MIIKNIDCTWTSKSFYKSINANEKLQKIF